MASKKEAKSGKALMLDFRYILLSVAAGLIYYVAYYFRFPNSFSIIVTLAFLAALIKGFKKVDGVKAIMYMMIYMAVIMPLLILIIPISFYFQIGLIALNWAILLLVITGLKELKMWGFYLTQFALMFSMVNVLAVFELLITQPPIMNIFSILFISRNVLTFAFLAVSFIYLVRSVKHFH